jgi:hypothetical protein
MLTILTQAAKLQVCQQISKNYQADCTSPRDQGSDPVTGPNPSVGFLYAYEPGKSTFESKKKTQEKWAYHLDYIQDAKIEEHNGQFYKTGRKWGYDNSKKYGSPGHQFKEPVNELLTHPPAIWDNTPMHGFKIVKSVSR